MSKKVCPRLKKRGACAEHLNGRCPYKHPPQPKVSPNWRRRNYRTKLCRNFPNCPYGDNCNFLHPAQPAAQPRPRTTRKGMGRPPQRRAASSNPPQTTFEMLLAAERRFHVEREHAAEVQPTPEACVPAGCEFMRGGAVAASAPPTPEMPVAVPVTTEQMEYPPPGIMLASAAPFAPAVVPVAPPPAASAASAAAAENEWLDDWLGGIGIRSEATVSELSKIFQDAEIDTPGQFALLFGDWIKNGKPRARTNPVKELQECIFCATGEELKRGVVGKLLTAMRGDAQIQNLLAGYE